MSVSIWIAQLKELLVEVNTFMQGNKSEVLALDGSVVDSVERFCPGFGAVYSPSDTPRPRIEVLWPSCELVVEGEL